MQHLSVITRVASTHLKREHVRSVLKKPNLGKAVLKKYRPYLSTTIARVGASRLSAHVSEHTLSGPHQSAYKTSQSAEPALDLLAAFDSVAHKVIMQRMAQQALPWLTSYLSDGFQSIHIQGATSPVRPVAYGVPKVQISALDCPPSMQHQLPISYAGAT